MNGFDDNCQRAKSKPEWQRSPNVNRGLYAAEQKIGEKMWVKIAPLAAGKTAYWMRTYSTLGSLIRKMPD